MRSAEKKKGREEIYIFIFLFSPSLSLPISKRESSSNGMASNSNYNTMTGRYGVRTREHTAAAALVHSKSAVLCCWNKKGLKLLGLLHSNGLFVSLHTIIAVRHTEDVLPHLEGLLHVFLCLLVFFVNHFYDDDWLSQIQPGLIHSNDPEMSEHKTTKKHENYKKLRSDKWV